MLKPGSRSEVCHGRLAALVEMAAMAGGNYQLLENEKISQAFSSQDLARPPSWLRPRAAAVRHQLAQGLEDRLRLGLLRLLRFCRNVDSLLQNGRLSRRRRRAQLKQVAWVSLRKGISEGMGQTTNHCTKKCSRPRHACASTPCTCPPESRSADFPTARNSPLAVKLGKSSGIIQSTNLRLLPRIRAGPVILVHLHHIVQCCRLTNILSRGMSQPDM